MVSLAKVSSRRGQRRPGAGHFQSFASGRNAVAKTALAATLAGVPIIDLKAGDEVYAQVLRALLERTETGQGQRIDVSMLQAAASWLITTLPLAHSVWALLACGALTGAFEAAAQTEAAPPGPQRNPFVRVANEAPRRPAAALPVEGLMPPIDGTRQWLNSPPLTAEALRDKVGLIDFWTYSCINCLNALPHVREWQRKYKDQGLVVLGVQAPEFAFERDLDNVRGAVKRLGITFPVVIDNDFSLWHAFGNRYWPAHYFVDARGRIRFHHFGEGAYEKSEHVIRQLLEEARGQARAP